LVPLVKLIRVVSSLEGVSERVLFYANSAIFQLYLTLLMRWW